MSHLTLVEHPRLPASANPTESSETLALAACPGEEGNPNEDPEFRRIWCRYYDACLDFAIIRRWDSFTCSACPVREDIDERQRAREAAGLVLIGRQAARSA